MSTSQQQRQQDGALPDGVEQHNTVKENAPALTKDGTLSMSHHYSGSETDPWSYERQGASHEAIDSTAAETDASAIAAAPSDGENTPPMPNGDKRLHPLLDEEQISTQAAAQRRLQRTSDQTHSSEEQQLRQSSTTTAAATKHANTQGNHASVTSTSTPNNSDRQQRLKSRPESLRVIDAMENEPGYPSPSGGFVPPVTDENWALSEPPAPRAKGTADAQRASAKLAASTSSPPSTSNDGASRIGGPTADEAVRSDAPVDSQLPQRSFSSSADVSSSSMDAATSLSSLPTTSSAAAAMPSSSSSSNDMPAPQASKRATFVTENSSSGAQHHRNASSTSSARFSEGEKMSNSADHSQAISARSSPSIVAPTRRRSSASADKHKSVTLNDDVISQDDQGRRTSRGSGIFLPPLKIRDFAYSEIDPRHVGARDVGLANADDEQRANAYASSSYGGGMGAHGWGSGADDYDEEDEDDEEEDDDSSGHGMTGFTSRGSRSTSSVAAAGLPPGLYHTAFDFTAESEHELDITVGQRVRVIGHVDGGWAIVVRVAHGKEDVAVDDEQSEKGLVPEAYLEWLGS